MTHVLANTSHVASKLVQRGAALARVRHFFAERNIVEVDVPALTRCGSVDAFIDLFAVPGGGYLHSSPEYAMKRLLAAGAPDCYYLGHVYRAEEAGKLHSAEFTMIEYYRLGWTLDQLIDETLKLTQLFLPDAPITRMSYEEALALAETTACPPGLTEQEAMHFLWATAVEPQMDGLWIIDGFPPSEAALAKVEDGVARRFEIYYNGVELANGYDELNSEVQLRARFMEANEKRIAMGKDPYPLDEEFLQAVDDVPECVGVAIGFDRLHQISIQCDTVADALATPDECKE